MKDESDRLHAIGNLLTYPRLILLLLVKSYGGTPPERVRYGPHPRQYMMVFEPVAPVRRAAVFFLHGGGWQSLRPEYFEAIGRFFARRGYAACLPAYRLAPRHKHPAQLNDAVAAYAEFLRRLSDSGLSDVPIVVGGNSAGAHIAAFLALDPRLCASEGHDRIRGLLSMAGPLRWDLPYPSAIKPLMRGLIRKVRAWPEADPFLLLQQPQMRWLLELQGAWDPLVRPQAAMDFAHAWSPDGSHAELHVLERHFHGDVCCDAFLKRGKERDWVLSLLARVEDEGLTALDEEGAACTDPGLPEPMRRERANPYLETDD
jgi:acetyl esterase/lipase